MLLGVIVVLPTALMYTAIGLLCGTLMSNKAVGGVCGAMLTTIAFILSGVTVPIQIMGPTFQDIAKALPFYNAAQSAVAAVGGGYGRIWPHSWIVIAYAVGFWLAAVIVFGLPKRNVNR